MRVYSGWLQPPQPTVVRASALSVRRPFDRLNNRAVVIGREPCSHPRTDLHLPGNGQVIAPVALVSWMSRAQLPQLAAIAAANSVAAGHHDDSQSDRSVLTN